MMRGAREEGLSLQAELKAAVAEATASLKEMQAAAAKVDAIIEKAEQKK